MQQKSILTIFIILVTSVCFAQFTIDGEFRPRTEYRHGFGSIIPQETEPGYGISTRARLNFGFKKETYELYFSAQDVLVWGENRQILPKDVNNSFAIFEAWANFKISENFYTKAGRQILSYDDQRILGGLDWAQQGRNHDALLLQFGKEKTALDVGLAFNQDYDEISGFQNTGNTYHTTGFFSYKTMQFLHFNRQWNTFNLSVLLLNNGFQEFDENDDADGISNLQTMGAHVSYQKNKFDAAGNIYFQTGKQQGNLKVNSAYLVGLDAHYKITSKIKLGVGFELISGTDVNSDANETSAFFPLYGTNHKFNGFMDYFYVGNHANSIGLVDFHINSIFTLGEHSNLLVSLLNFSGDEALPSGEKNLGTEVDLVYSHKFKEFSISVGYSQMFASDGMYELKGVSENTAADTQNWAWAMLVLKPKFL
ncbi:alginate export family protein [Formosa sp. A9]|uniref:alginate export family protein n=1 Tax=Formosa sp. A9 TaxID=3442641 RepID=UPI003EC0E37B